MGLARAALGNSTGFRLTTSTYGYDPVTDTAVPLGITKNTAGVPDFSYFTATTVNTNYLPLLRAHKVIAISEVWYDFVPFFSVPWLSPAPFYDVTIY